MGWESKWRITPKYEKIFIEFVGDIYSNNHCIWNYVPINKDLCKQSTILIITKMEELINKPYDVLPTVLFTEDGWNTTYEGCIIESSIYSHRIRSRVYGEFWIPKENVRTNQNKRKLQQAT